jgi:hypothetical protein
MQGKRFEKVEVSTFSKFTAQVVARFPAYAGKLSRQLTL